MKKKIFLSIILVLFMAIGIEVFEKEQRKRVKEINSENEVENITEISEYYVTDDCINELKDDSNTKKKEIEKVNLDINSENQHFIVIAEEGVIKVYYIDENKEKILYKSTDLPLEYLAEKDVEKLLNGFNVYGVENLNKLLEDFE